MTLAELNNVVDYLAGIWTVFVIMFWVLSGFRDLVCRWSATLCARPIHVTVTLQRRRRLP